jgi:hypothetical protein
MYGGVRDSPLSPALSPEGRAIAYGSSQRQTSKIDFHRRPGPSTPPAATLRMNFGEAEGRGR